MNKRRGFTGRLMIMINYFNIILFLISLIRFTYSGTPNPLKLLLNVKRFLSRINNFDSWGIYYSLYSLEVHILKPEFLLKNGIDSISLRLVDKLLFTYKLSCIQGGKVFAQ